jgi:hypothetical protein
MSNNEPEQADRAEQVLDYIAHNWALEDPADSLLNDQQRWSWRGADVEPDRKEEVEAMLHRDTNSSEGLHVALRRVLLKDNALGLIESEILDRELRLVSHRSETGWDRNRVTESRAEDLPDHLARRLIRSEIDAIENSMVWDDPKQYERSIGLYQLLGRYTSPESTRPDRRELWDELLKFTKYKVEVEFTPHDADAPQTKFYHLWRQSSSSAHNDALSQFGRDHNPPEVNIRTFPEELREPTLDPLDDLDEWVRRYYW